MCSSINTFSGFSAFNSCALLFPLGRVVGEGGQGGWSGRVVEEGGPGGWSGRVVGEDGQGGWSERLIGE